MVFIDAFKVVLLDMNGTFVFGHDRFGPEQDYFATYRLLGGDSLDRDRFLATWTPSLGAVLARYDDPAYVDDFPSLAEVFTEFGAAPNELPMLERVFAAHEIGHVPPAHAAWIRNAAMTHQLGVVSNLFSNPAVWLHNCVSAPVFDSFKALVFSSEGRSVKPSPALFQRALAQFPSGQPVLFVGDNLNRDIIPAKALGLATAWIAPPGASHPAADRVVALLPELA